MLDALPINHVIQPVIHHSTLNWKNKTSMFEQLKEISISTFPNNPVMQRVALCQAVLESRLNGIPSQLAVKYNNLFGIKSSHMFHGTRPNTILNTEEDNGYIHHVNAQFSANNSPYDSFHQYKILMSLPRYRKVFNAKTIEDAIDSLQTSGYSTDPHYSVKLSKIYRNQIAPLFKDKL